MEALDSSAPMRPRALAPAWIFAVLGWLTADILRPPAEPIAIAQGDCSPGGAQEGLPCPDRLSGKAEPPGSEHDLATMNARELRQLPGVGEGRARAMAVARWQRDR